MLCHRAQCEYDITGLDDLFKQAHETLGRILSYEK